MHLFTFSNIVSLGYRCALAYNLRRYYKFGTSFPFDWWISPASGLANFINAGMPLDVLYDRKKLDLTPRGNSVRHSDYGILLHHEFPRDWKAEGQPIVSDFLNHIEGPKQRTAYLIDRFQALAGDSRSLYIRDQQNDDEGDQIVDAMEYFFATKLRSRVLSLRGPTEEAVVGWKCEPSAWDTQLRDLNIGLDYTIRKPFHEVGGRIDHSEL